MNCLALALFLISAFYQRMISVQCSTTIGWNLEDTSFTVFLQVSMHIETLDHDHSGTLFVSPAKNNKKCHPGS